MVTGTSTFRSMIRSGNNLVHFHHLFHDLRYGDNDYLLHGALLNALLWDQSHNFVDLLNDLRNVLRNCYGPLMHSSTSPPLTISSKSGHWRVDRNHTHNFNDLLFDSRNNLCRRHAVHPRGNLHNGLRTQSCGTSTKCCTISTSTICSRG